MQDMQDMKESFVRFWK